MSTWLGVSGYRRSRTRDVFDRERQTLYVEDPNWLSRCDRSNACGAPQLAAYLDVAGSVGRQRIACASLRADQSLLSADGRTPLRLQREAAEEEKDRGEGDGRRDDESEADANA